MDMSQMCTGAGDYFRTSKPHSEKLWVIMTSPIDENLCSSALTKKIMTTSQSQGIYGLSIVYTTFYISICRIFHQNYQSCLSIQKLMISDLT